MNDSSGRPKKPGLPLLIGNRRQAYLLAGFTGVLLFLVVAGIGLWYWRTSQPDYGRPTPGPTVTPRPTPIPNPNLGFMPLIFRQSTPTWSPTPTLSPTPTATLTPVPSPTPRATATPTAILLTFCDTTSGPLAIRDYEQTRDFLIVNFDGLIHDLNVSLDISHGFIGDLVVRLRRDDGIERTLLNRIGQAPDYCDGNDINVILDDEATINANPSCGPGIPSLTGRGRPVDPLNRFDQVPIRGGWSLTIEDRSSPDEGTLNGWCLIATVR